MKKTSTDKSILFVTYIMVGLFVGLMGYFGYFLQVQSETVINNIDFAVWIFFGENISGNTGGIHDA